MVKISGQSISNSANDGPKPVCKKRKGNSSQPVVQCISYSNKTLMFCISTSALSTLISIFIYTCIDLDSSSKSPQLGIL